MFFCRYDSATELLCLHLRLERVETRDSWVVTNSGNGRIRKRLLRIPSWISKCDKNWRFRRLSGQRLPSPIHQWSSSTVTATATVSEFLSVTKLISGKQKIIISSTMFAAQDFQLSQIHDFAYWLISKGLSVIEHSLLDHGDIKT